jgi:ethanolamine utilization microcompartment shell protein EutL
MKREQRRSIGRNPPPSGGAGHGDGKRHEDLCPICGGKMLPEVERVVSREEVEELGNGKGYVWKGR